LDHRPNDVAYIECVKSKKEMSMTTDSNQPGQRSAGPPPKQGLYDPAFEKDACGVGFVVNIKGEKSHQIVRQAMTVLVNLNHRGACGCEANTGDGAGINLQIPDKFLRQAAGDLGFDLPAPGHYGVGMIFLPKDAELRAGFEAIFEQIVVEEGQKVLGWRTVPTNNVSLGDSAKAGEPFVRQVFIGRNADTLVGSDTLAFERKLYVIRKRAEHAIRYSNHPQGNAFYIPSLSSRTVVYKGMLLAEQVDEYLPGFARSSHGGMAIAVVHSRFSTNTFPSWERAHPYRYHDPQRRDQHHPRQRQLDVRPPVGDEIRTLRRRPGKGEAADRRSRWQLIAPNSTTLWNSCTWPVAHCTTWR
jgi:glutamate synthase (NADPH/NADH) large chain